MHRHYFGQYAVLREYPGAITPDGQGGPKPALVVWDGPMGEDLARTAFYVARVITGFEPRETKTIEAREI